MVLALLAGLLAPVAVVAGWAATLVTDTDVFVATYTPVVRSDAVNTVLTDRLTRVISEQLGIAENRLLQPVVARVVSEAAASDAFATATTTGLRLAHAELVSLLTGDPGRLQVTNGEVQLRLAPFVEAITSRLTAAGVPFLDRLPQVTGGITLLQIDPNLVPVLQTVYRLMLAVAALLPWAALALALAAVWAWPGARGALIAIGLSLVGWVLVASLAWRTVMQGVMHRLGDDLALVGGLVATVTTAPILSPLLALAVAGALLTFLGALAASPAPTLTTQP